MKFLKRKIRCKTTLNCEDLSENFIDKDVQSMLLPLNLPQQFFVCPKYSIKDNFISPNSHLQCLVSLCGTLIFISFLFYRFCCRTFSLNINEYYKVDLDGVTFFDFFFNSVGILLNFFAVIFQTNENVIFVLKFVYIHSFLNNRAKFERFIVGNWLSVIGMFVFGISIVTLICLTLKLPTHDFFCGIILMSFDTNIVYVIRLIKLLKDKLDVWNIQVLNFQRLGNRDGEDSCNRLYQVYIYILDCYDICKVSFQKVIVFHCISLFFNSLIHIQIELENSKSEGFESTFVIFLINVWLVKTLMYEIILSLEFEKFYMTVNQVHDTCALLLSSNSTDEEKRLYKNIKRLNEAVFDKMDACGMFYVDANLPLEMMMLITNYTIVLLQFALL